MLYIVYHLVTAIGTQLSHDTISKITDEVLEEVSAWQERPLEEWRFLANVANPSEKRDKSWHDGLGTNRTPKRNDVTSY